LDILQGVQREVGGAAARSYGSFFLPHCDHLGIPLPSSITPEGEVGVHDGQAGEGRHQARGRAPGPGAGVGRGGGASAVTVAAQQCRALSTTTVRGSAGYAKGSVRGEARPHHGPRERLGKQKGQRLGSRRGTFRSRRIFLGPKKSANFDTPTIILFFITTLERGPGQINFLVFSGEIFSEKIRT
jgi:hypothetical protein